VAPTIDSREVSQLPEDVAFDMQIEQDRDRAYVRLAGEFDFGSRDEFRRRIGMRPGRELRTSISPIPTRTWR
jgi:hypothetical protein